MLSQIPQSRARTARNFEHIATSNIFGRPIIAMTETLELLL
jgi:hypothetical protein